MKPCSEYLAAFAIVFPWSKGVQPCTQVLHPKAIVKLTLVSKHKSSLSSLSTLKALDSLNANIRPVSGL